MSRCRTAVLDSGGGSYARDGGIVGSATAIVVGFCVGGGGGEPWFFFAFIFSQGWFVMATAAAVTVVTIAVVVVVGPLIVSIPWLIFIITVAAAECHPLVPFAITSHIILQQRLVLAHVTTTRATDSAPFVQSTGGRQRTARHGGGIDGECFYRRAFEVLSADETSQ